MQWPPDPTIEWVFGVISTAIGHVSTCRWAYMKMRHSGGGGVGGQIISDLLPLISKVTVTLKQPYRNMNSSTYISESFISISLRQTENHSGLGVHFQRSGFVRQPWYVPFIPSTAHLCRCLGTRKQDSPMMRLLHAVDQVCFLSVYGS